MFSYEAFAAKEKSNSITAIIYKSYETTFELSYLKFALHTDDLQRQKSFMAVLCDHVCNSQGSEYDSYRIKWLNSHLNP